MRTLIKFLLLALTLAYCPTVDAQPRIKPAEEPLALTGVLRVVHGYGPPGYGADKSVDVKFSYWALELPAEINLACTPDRPSLADIQCGATKQPRLFFPEDKRVESKARKMINKHVTITGVLHRSTGMYRATPIYVDVIDVDQLSKPK